MDLDKARAEKMCAQYGGIAYDTFAQVLADEKVDAVILCNANCAHAEMSVQALQAGKHVLCEKPMALTDQQAQAVCRAAEAAQTLYMVAHNQRFDPANQKAKELLEQGAIGRVLTFQAAFCHGGPENWSIDAKKSMYFEKSASGFGALGDLAVHKIDLLRWMLATEFTTVYAHCATLDKKDSAGQPIAVDDNVILTLQTKAGAMGTVKASWTNYSCCESYVVLCGEKGKLEVFDGSNGAGTELCLYTGQGAIQRFPIENNGPSGVVDAFCKAILERAPSPVSAQEGTADIKILQAAMESSAIGKERILPETPQDERGET